MRKNSPRKWLHAILDLLPVLILPIFGLAVRSDNNFQPIELQVQEDKVVDFNQLVQNGNFEDNSLWGTTNASWSVNDNVATFTPIENTDSTFYQSLSQIKNCKVLLKFDYKADIEMENAFFVFFSFNNWSGYKYFNTLTTWQTGYDLFDVGDVNNSQLIIFRNLESVEINVNYKNVQVFNLTQMFGSGNEPTIEQFNTWYNEPYYDYTLSHKELLKDYSTITYNDTDVGSQMVYTLYNATDKYFNFNNVFNFGQIYDWFVLNIFNGNPTLIFSVVWQIVLYEFIMDLVFLIYALFMFFIDFCTNLIDRFHVKCSGGK